MITKQEPNKEGQAIGQDLVAMMKALTEIMNAETEALKIKDVKSVERSSLKKIQLLREYQKSLAVLAQNPTILKEIDGGLRKELQATRKTCESAAQRNSTSLKGALKATQHLIETIVQAAIKSTKKMESYSDPRTKHLELGAQNRICDPVAYCRVI